MSTLKLILELRARQIATIQADLYWHQKRQSIFENTATLIDSTRTKIFNQSVPLQSITTVSSPLSSSMQTPPVEWNGTNLLLNMFTDRPLNHLQGRRESMIIENSTLASSYAPARAKRCNLKKAPSNDCNELHKMMQSDKNHPKWHGLYGTLTEFKKSHGHCIVPRNYEDTTLASWVRTDFSLFFSFILAFANIILQS